jgi:hypothetical protein
MDFLLVFLEHLLGLKGRRESTFTYTDAAAKVLFDRVQLRLEAFDLPLLGRKGVILALYEDFEATDFIFEGFISLIKEASAGL